MAPYLKMIITITRKAIAFRVVQEGPRPSWPPEASPGSSLPVYRPELAVPQPERTLWQ